MVQGMSYVQLYKNKACTRELKKDSEGKYLLDIEVLTGNSQSPYQIILYAKNNGSHKAYDVSLELLSSSLSNTAVVNQKNTLESLEDSKITITFPTASLQRGNHSIEMRLNYDSV